MSKALRLRPPRRIRPGAAAERHPGAVLSCAVLATGPEEWVAVDLVTGAYVRTRPAQNGSAAVPGAWSTFDVALVEAGVEHDPPDPGRPEAVPMANAPERAGVMRRGAARRLLRRLAAPERRWVPILGTRGPSIAYVDLDLTTPSVVLVAVSPKRLGCTVRERGDVRCSFDWGGTTQSLPLLDARVRRAVLGAAPEPFEPAALVAAVGGKPAYLLVGLAAVRDGHAPKVVLSILPKSRPKG